MEQLSFASVYRTAAILAAFSHASAAGEHPNGCAPWPYRDGAPLASAALSGSDRSFFDTCRDILRRCRMPRPGHPFGIEDRTRSNDGDLMGQAEGWTSMGPHRPCVTSHFAFADDAKRMGSGV